MLSVSGSSSSGLFAVGADQGSGPLVVHFDDASWTQLTVASNSTDTLFTVNGAADHLLVVVGAASGDWVGGAGGDVLNPALGNGMLVHYGNAVPSLTLSSPSDAGTDGESDATPPAVCPPAVVSIAKDKSIISATASDGANEAGNYADTTGFASVTRIARLPARSDLGRKRRGSL
ncbi:MAG: hypothetical protein ACHREM_27055 [Polyangiales bacterium]